MYKEFQHNSNYVHRTEKKNSESIELVENNMCWVCLSCGAWNVCVNATILRNSTRLSLFIVIYLFIEKEEREKAKHCQG